MKLITLISCLMLSSHLLADSASFKVPKFKGELMLEPSDVKIEAIEVRAHIQHCNFWGTTCAGGPSETETRAMTYKMNTATNLLVIENSEAISLRSFKPGNRFSSCKLSITLLGKTAQNQKVEGYLSLIHDNNKDNCESLKTISERIAEKFKVPQRIKFFNRY
jgi:hypothetical protein